MIIPDRPAELTLANWDLGGPVSEWSYRHTADLFPTEVLVPASVIQESHDHLGGNQVPRELVDDLQSGRVSAISILAGGVSAFRWPDGPARGQLLMSVSKVFASLAVGMLADSGGLDYTAPVRAYLPELGSQWEPCRVQHILDMTSGVECPEVGDPGAYSDPGHPFYQFEASLGWRPTSRTTSPYDLVLSYGRSGLPGSRYAYMSVNTFLLAWIVERITALTYPQALQHLIWDRLDLTHSSVICNHAGVAVAHGGLVMSADDLARFGTLFTPSRSAGQHAFRVPGSYLDMLRAPRDELTPAVGAWPVGAHPGGQWNLIHPDGDMYKSGFGGQGLYVSPGKDVVIAFCGIPDEHARTHQLAQKCSDLATRFAFRR